MGTRGTLHVYLNDELKVRQYNQWDSYPTGQFDDICHFMKDERNVLELATKLCRMRFFTREEFDRFKAVKMSDRLGDIDLDEFINISFLTNRDYGADILYQIISLCRNTNEYPEYSYRMIDWAMIDNDEEHGLAGEEGNYVIRLRVDDMNELKKWNNQHVKVHFTLSGDWHDSEHEFPEDYIPTDDEIEAWEKEVR